MSTNLSAVLQELLQNTSNLKVLRQLMTPNATYVSLTFDNPELKKVMPWAGTHKGPQALFDVFAAIQSFGKHSISRSPTPLSRVAASPSSALLLTNRTRPGRKLHLHLVSWRVSRGIRSLTSSFSKTAMALQVRSKQEAQLGFTAIPRGTRLRSKAEHVSNVQCLTSQRLAAIWSILLNCLARYFWSILLNCLARYLRRIHL
jgi:hypothetical protein